MTNVPIHTSSQDDHIQVGNSIIKQYTNAVYPTNPLRRHLTGDEMQLIRKFFPNHTIHNAIDANGDIFFTLPGKKSININDLSKLIVIPRKPIKLIPYPKNNDILFSNCGVEPTFYPIVKLHPGLSQFNNELIDEIWETIVCDTHYKSLFRNKHPWLSDCGEDDNNLEVRSNHKYTTVSGITNDYKKLLKVLNTQGFEASSISGREVEGGCHVNFNLADKMAKYGSTYENLVKIFCFNVVNFLNNYPSLVWALLAPEDNESSNIFTSFPLSITSLRKGDFITIRSYRNRDNDGIFRDHIEYIELRFFMMPRTAEEFAYHILVGSNILKYLWNLTIKEPHEVQFKIKNSKASLKKYTFSKSLKELHSILPKLGLHYTDFIKFGKIDMLKERFSFGKNYLV